MPNYRRVFVPGGCYFFTVNLLDRHSHLLVEHIDHLRAAVRDTRRNYPIHTIWTLPDGDANFPARWHSIKSRFSKSIPKGERLDAVQKANGERGIWQRRYWEHAIRDERDLNNHIDYCWFNPVKHGLVAKVEDWPFSSFHRDRRGTPNPDDFEKALAEHARQSHGGQFGERE
jgi:putative transposase